MEPSLHTFWVYHIFSQLRLTFLASHIVVSKFSLNSFLDFGPFRNFSLNFWVKLFPQFSFQTFLFFNKIPNGLILDLKKFNPSFVFIENHFLLCEFSWQIIRININWSFNWLWNQLFGLLLKIFWAQEERNHTSGWIVGRNTTDLWFHVSEIAEFIGQGINGFEIFLKFGHFMM